MKLIRVALNERSYPIYIADSYATLPQAMARAGVSAPLVVISHRSLLRRFGHQLLEPLRRAGFNVTTIAIAESERSKSYEMAERVMEQLARRGRMRVPALLAFGGGVIGDLTGFVAAVFRRGVPYVQVPTTLLAQVDSAIGGKVGVDLPFAKNFIGAFYQPTLVFQHLGVLRTLSLRQRRSGLGEIVKYAMMADAELFEFLETHVRACLAGELRVDRVMVERCCRIKARIVSQDERETKGLRTHLNFGHTLGHALEASTHYRRFTHGEAIAVGMACASAFSVALGRLRGEDHTRLLRLLHALGLPTKTTGIAVGAVRDVLRHDKKFIHGTMRWVLPTRIGRVVVTEAVPASVMWDVIRAHVT